MAARSLVWLGVRTARFAEMIRLYRDGLGLAQIQASETAARCCLGDGNEIHVYAQTDENHAFFGSGPVICFLVDDFAARGVLRDQGAEFIGNPQIDGDTIRNHDRAPDGNVYEIMQRGG